MVRRNTWKSTVGLATLFALIGSAPVWAHGPERGEFGPPGPIGMRPGGYPGGLLLQLVYPCQADCVSTARTCNDTADSDASSCVSAACPTEIQTTQSACAADHRAQACLDAVNALRTCAQSCLSTRQTALTNCRDALGVCRQACTASTPTPTP
jgi:hypothetical protein